MKYHSDALRIGVSVNVVIPENAKSLIGMKSDGDSTYKTLYLLHGLSDDHSIWMRRTSIERYAAEYGIAVVMPSVNRSWYTDTPYGANYLTFVAKELPQVCRGFFRGMSDKKEDNMIAGLSMGGYGALKIAMLNPDQYSCCAAFSGALDIASFAKRLPLDEVRGNFGYDLQSGEELVDSKHDVYELARQNCDKKLPFPKLYMWCGTEDELLVDNRRFHALLDEKGVEHRYEESGGNHGWRWWDEQIKIALDYFFNK